MLKANAERKAHHRKSGKPGALARLDHSHNTFVWNNPELIGKFAAYCRRFKVRHVSSHTPEHAYMLCALP
eukprot:463224-Pyramimonas_sp.AAC.2